MYKFKDNQLSLTDFGAAVGLKLNMESRWIKVSRWNKSRFGTYGSSRIKRTA